MDTSPTCTASKRMQDQGNDTGSFNSFIYAFKYSCLSAIVQMANASIPEQKHGSCVHAVNSGYTVFVLVFPAVK